MADTNPTDQNPTSLDDQKKALEIEKLKLESKELQKKWFRRPQWWAILFPTFFSIIPIAYLISTGIIDSKYAEFKANSARFDLEKTKFTAFQDSIQTQRNLLTDSLSRLSGYYRARQDSMMLISERMKDSIRSVRESLNDSLRNTRELYESVRDSLIQKINALQCNDRNLFMPNAFSPDGDGVNDIFKPRSSAQLYVKSFVIYDKFGATVYQEENLPVSQLKGWNGIKNGTALKNDVFIWKLELICDGTSKSFLGNVTTF